MKTLHQSVEPITNVNGMLGLTLASIQVANNQDLINFTTTCGRVFVMYHSQDCCEEVEIEDICGDLKDLIGSPLTNSEEVSNYHKAFSLIHPTNKEEESDDSFTWTYYKFDTNKGGVTIRWFGTSNGYYSEDVDFKEITQIDEYESYLNISNGKTPHTVF